MGKLNQHLNGHTQTKDGHMDKLKQLLNQQLKWNTVSLQRYPITYIYFNVNFSVFSLNNSFINP